MQNYVSLSTFNVGPLAVEGHSLRVRNLNNAHPCQNHFWGRIVSLTPIPDTGVKDTTTAYRPFCGSIVSLKFRKHLPMCNGNIPWTWSTGFLAEV